MQKRRVFWQFFPVLFLTMVLGVSLVLLVSHSKHRESVVQATYENLSLLSKILITDFTGSDHSLVELSSKVVKGLDGKYQSLVRVDLIDSSGLLLESSDQEYKANNKQENFLDRPELTQAFLGSQSHLQRKTLGSNREPRYYFVEPVLVPVTEGATSEKSFKVSHILRLSLPVAKVQLYSAKNKFSFLAIIGFILVSIFVISYLVSSKFSRPLVLMKDYAKKVSKGDFKSRIRLDPAASYEAHRLSQSMNRIAIQLNRRIESVTRQKNVRETILASMGEGLLAIDKDRKVVLVNDVACKILGSTSAGVEGQSLHEAFRMPELLNFVEDSLRIKSLFKKDIKVAVGSTEKTLNIKSGIIAGESGEGGLAVFVFDDVTQVRQLELHRTEFVANVSHELRTPLTSIRGFSETLLNQKVPDEDRKKFLEIIHRHASRLDEIIDDLLSLSRVEQGAESREIELVESRIEPVLKAARDLCQPKLLAQNVGLEISGDTHLKAVINAPLLEQAIANLIDNAVRYSAVGGRVDLSVSQATHEIVISVQDYGIGIDKKHLSRLFERFYRVDKSRSREDGGTGLGLAIVKHVVQAQKGRVEVQSMPGKGSVFRIFIPKQESNRNQTKLG